MICLVHILLEKLMKLLMRPESVLTKLREKNNHVELKAERGFFKI